MNTTSRGFTLAELLIALAILGVIATFTIPKVLQAQQSEQWNAEAKELASMISGAYQSYKGQNQLSAATGWMVMTPYMNYVKFDSSTVLDDITGAGSRTCGAGTILCLRLHNGGIARIRTNNTFGGTSNLNALWMSIDPDGKYSGSTTGQGKALTFYLYADGRLVDGKNRLANTDTWEGGSSPGGYPAATADTNETPSWFQWE